MNDMTTRMHIESPVGLRPGPGDWGSDYLAEVMRALGTEHVVLVPGASGPLHDGSCTASQSDSLVSTTACRAASLGGVNRTVTT